MTHENLHYSAIGNEITISLTFHAMSGRDKSALFRQLIDDSGLLAEVFASDEACRVIDMIGKALWDKDAAALPKFAGPKGTPFDEEAVE